MEPAPRFEPFRMSSRSQLLLAAILPLCGLLAWAADRTNLRSKLQEAEAQLRKEFPAAAAGTLDPIRHRLTGDLRGCEALIGAYFGTRDTERLAWAAESCLDAGLDSPSLRTGLAASRELMGRDEEALRILDAAVARFESSPDPHYRAALVLRRLKRDDAAADALARASERAPGNAQLGLDALEALLGQNRFGEARRVAERIRSVATERADIKLLIARALLRGGDPAGARAVADQARALLATKPEARAAMQAQFADVLGAPEPSGPQGSPARQPASESR